MNWPISLSFSGVWGGGCSPHRRTIPRPHTVQVWLPKVAVSWEESGPSQAFSQVSHSAAFDMGHWGLCRHPEVGPELGGRKENAEPVLEDPARNSHLWAEGSLSVSLCLSLTVTPSLPGPSTESLLQQKPNRPIVSANLPPNCLLDSLHESMPLLPSETGLRAPLWDGPCPWLAPHHRHRWEGNGRLPGP